MADYSAFVVDPIACITGVDSYAGLLYSYAAPVEYAQRIWSTGGAEWCYYIGAINASPASTDTTPNWVTSAIRHEVLGIV